MRPVTAESRIAGRYIPAGARRIEGHAGGVAYAYEAGGSPYAIAYQGSSGKATLHYRYRTEAQRDKAIAEFFEACKRRADYKAAVTRVHVGKFDIRALQTSPQSLVSYGLTETASIVRWALGESFPGVKFSVRSESYSMGCTIRVSWVDGPTGSQVNPILDRFSSSDFDSMQDMKTYRGAATWHGKKVKFTGDYIRGQRTESAALLREASAHVARRTGLPVLEVVEGGGYANYTGGHSAVPFQYHRYENVICRSDQPQMHAEICSQVAYATSKCATVAVELPVAGASK